MARKKQEIALQREIETQEEWEEVMAMEGLWVIDVYQEWCGPCQALVGNFRRLKNELGDPLLHYAMAKADTIDGLDKYRGRCEPTFLFFAGGILVSFIHGANAPKLQRVITEQLAQEHKVLDGSGERKEVKDTFITRQEEKALEKAEAEEAAREAEDGEESYSWKPLEEEEDDEGEAMREELRLASKEEQDLLDESLGKSSKEVPKGVTIAIIKPDAVAQGKVDEIIQEITDQGLEIVAREDRELTEDEAMKLYSELKDESYFNDLIKFIISGPSCLLVITSGKSGETVVKDWREMIGPTQVEAAKEDAPYSLRAKYGDSGYMNALHGSSSSESAARELAFFFPNLAVPTFKRKKLNIQRTLALIRPEAFSSKKDEILAKITEAGFKIAMYKEIQLTKEQVNDFYKEHEGQAYFEQLVEHMTSGPVLALGLAGDEAISGWREMLGPPNVDEATETSPKSLRAVYTGASGINQFHGSDSPESSKKELNFFFPMEETVAVIKPGAMGTKDAIIGRIHEAGFKIAARKETTITREIAEMMYPEHAEADYYNDLIESMISGPTMFMVLSREDAVDGWRQEIGEVNPEDAKVTNPDSLRAQFGTNVLHNAVHGSSNPARAKQEMKAVFGDLEFNADGTVKGEEPELEETSEALKKGRSSPVAETAPEYRNQEDDTTADETTADETTDADTTMDTTQNVTADTTQVDQTQEATTEEETAKGDATTVETTEPETTAADTTTQDATADESEGDTTQADTTQADTTMTDTTQADTTQADTTQVDETQVEEAPAEQTKEATEAEPTASAADGQTDATETETTSGETTAQAPEEPSPAAEEKPAETTETKVGDEKATNDTPQADDETTKDSPQPEAAASEEPAAQDSTAMEEPAQEVKTSGSPLPAEEEAKTEVPTPPVESTQQTDAEAKGDGDDTQNIKGQGETVSEDTKGDTTGSGETPGTDKPTEPSS